MELKAGMRRQGMALGLAVGLVMFAAGASAAPPVISAAGGAATFADKCSGCHGATGGGGEHAPPLTGADFWSQWQGKPLRKLYSRIISTMPENDPGTLTEQQTLGIVAFLTKLNTGTAPNPPYTTANALNTVIVAGAKPKSDR